MGGASEYDGCLWMISLYYIPKKSEIFRCKFDIKSTDFENIKNEINLSEPDLI